jgi:replicative DNA helicase
MKAMYQYYGVQVDEDRPRFGQQYDKNKMFDWSDTIRADGGQQPNTPIKKEPAPAAKEPEKDYTDYFIECQTKTDTAAAAEYFAKRGISPQTVFRYKLGFDPYAQPYPNVRMSAVVIPNSAHSYTLRNVNEQEKKFRFCKVGPADLFNSNVLASDTTVFVCEGSFDVLSVLDLGYSAVGLNSTNNANLFLKALDNAARNGRTKATPVIIALDNDDKGRQAAAQLTDAIQKAGYRVANLTSELCSTHKDLNERLTADRDGLAADLAHALAIADALPIPEPPKTDDTPQSVNDLEPPKMPLSNADLFRDFIASIDGTNTAAVIKTGFPNLDRALDGGLYEGLYFIGAVSSLGKTTFLMQLADNVARSGHDVLIFSLEMSRNQLMSKSISRLTFEQTQNRELAKTTRQITRPEIRARLKAPEQQIIQDAINVYTSQIAPRIYTYEAAGDMSVNDIEAALRNYMSAKRAVINADRQENEPEKHPQPPLIILDYLQILAPLNDRSTDKQNTDRAVTALKRMSRDYKASVLAISSFNRDNYTEPVSMKSFKESGAVEYSSDVLIGLQIQGVGKSIEKVIQVGEKKKTVIVPAVDVNEELEKTPRKIELLILKNREGQLRQRCYFTYDPRFNYYAPDPEPQFLDDREYERFYGHPKGMEELPEDAEITADQATPPADQLAKAARKGSF